MPARNDLVFQFGTDATAPLAFNVDAATLQAALNGLPGIAAAGGVVVDPASSGGWMIDL